MEFESILFHFLHNTDINMLYRQFSDRKYMYIYLPTRQEYGYLINLWTLVTFTLHYT